MLVIIVIKLVSQIVVEWTSQPRFHVTVVIACFFFCLAGYLGKLHMLFTCLPPKLALGNTLTSTQVV